MYIIRTTCSCDLILCDFECEPEYLHLKSMNFNFATRKINKLMTLAGGDWHKTFKRACWVSA